MHTRGMHATDIAATNMTARGNVDIGNPTAAGGTVTFRGPRVVEANSPLRTRGEHRAITRAQLWAWLNGNYGTAATGAGLVHPIIGTVNARVGNAHNITITVTHLTRNSATEFRLHGILTRHAAQPAQEGEIAFLIVRNSGLVQLGLPNANPNDWNVSDGATRVSLVQI